ncbi:nuclear transport factor 2 family protein [uncultured Allomuricauda sp.]|uniref:nuclear transport factor 2 family protein n=1 Tax=Flagellimonas sp. W118 TaxID=3410791 RepID=UPI002604478C|nr:nuclear transport factor 2 family protein [uncultured Allomuricauda sp.]
MKKKHYTIFMFLSFLIGFSQVESEQKQQTRSPFLFNPQNLDQNSKDLSAIYKVMADYYKGVEKANTTLLDKVFHTDWFMRDTETQHIGSLHIESKQKFIQRVADHGPYHGYAKDRKFASIGLANDNIAFVRVNKTGATSFFLYKLDGEWILMDKLWATIDLDNTQRNGYEYSNVHELLHSYFEAVQNSNQKMLNQLLHSAWDKKILNHQNNYSIIDKKTWLKNLKTNPYPSDPIKLVSTDLYNGKLAIVRVDFTEESTTTFFICFKMNGQWTIAGERTTIGS